MKLNMIGLRKSFLWAAFLISVSLACSGCQTMSSVKGSSQDFVSATNTLVQAESDYFDEIQAASDSAHRLQAAADYVAHNGTFEEIQEALNKRDDFSKAKQARLTVMKQLQNYAAVIASITSGSDASWISSDANNLITDSNKIVADTGGKQLTAAQVGLIQTAVTKLGQAVIDAASAKELQSLAQQAQEPIKLIVNMIDQDDKLIEKDKFAEGLVKDQTNALVNILHCFYNDSEVNSDQRFSAMFKVMNWKPSLVTKGPAIKAAVAKLQAANDALAKKQNESAIDLVKQAYAVLNTPSTSK